MEEQTNDFYSRLMKEKPLDQLLAEAEKRGYKSLEDELNIRVENNNLPILNLQEAPEVDLVKVEPKNLEKKVDEIGGRKNLYFSVINKFIGNTKKETKQTSRSLYQKINHSLYESKQNVKENIKELREIPATFYGAGEMLFFGFLPSKLQDKMVKKYLPDFYLDEQESAGMVSLFNIIGEGLISLFGMQGEEINPIIAIPLVIDAIGRGYILAKKEKSSGIGEGILQIPKMFRDGLDYMCIRYLNDSNKELKLEEYTNGRQ